MKGSRLFARVAVVFIVLSFAIQASDGYSQQPSNLSGILTRDQAGPLFPPSVFYLGKVAPIQTRNSAGYRYPDGKLVLIALVDTSGYASSVQQTYQGYLITEVPLRFPEGTLAPGAYGFGFIAGNRMVAMDLGGNELISTSTMLDSTLPRPNPLQISVNPGSSESVRLYLGRTYVTLQVASKP